MSSIVQISLLHLPISSFSLHHHNQQQQQNYFCSCYHQCHFRCIFLHFCLSNFATFLITVTLTLFLYNSCLALLNLPHIFMCTTCTSDLIGLGRPAFL